MIAWTAGLALGLALGAPPVPFWATESCRTCHASIVEEHLGSHHERSFANPTFQAQYFRELLPRLAAEPELAEEARSCTACHAPVVAARTGGHATSPADGDATGRGVTCDVCHVIVGFAGRAPGNGNFVLKPGELKYGPIAGRGDWHHAYSELHLRSELCATCHEATNRHGFAVKTTFSEWKEGPFAARGVQCQDCHMSLDGFLATGQSRFATGAAARATHLRPQEVAQLHTHRFPGAHSRSQVEGAVSLTFSAPQRAPAGKELPIRLAVDNGRTGHAMPSGSADLRLLWLEVSAEVDGKASPLAVAPRWAPSYEAGRYEVAGSGRFDAEILGGDVPRGSRVYRAVFADAAGKATLASWDATAMLCDTRLRAGEIRTERYAFAVPAEATGPVVLRARLRYRSAPSAFTRRLGLPPAEVIDVAAVELRVPVKAE